MRAINGRHGVCCLTATYVFKLNPTLLSGSISGAGHRHANGNKQCADDRLARIFIFTNVPLALVETFIMVMQ